MILDDLLTLKVNSKRL